MIKQEVITYKSADGKIFNSSEKCLAYEQMKANKENCQLNFDTYKIETMEQFSNIVQFFMNENHLLYLEGNYSTNDRFYKIYQKQEGNYHALVVQGFNGLVEEYERKIRELKEFMEKNK